MKTPIFTGSGVAIVTPMNKDGSVNYSKLDTLIEFQIANGTDAIIACGTTGESATLNHDEHCEVISHTIKTVNKRVPVIAGAGSNDTSYAVELSQFAKEAGADGILSVTPYYNKTSQAGLVKHYTYIADRVDIPMIVYNVPSRTGCNIKPETYFELSKHKNIVATKEANGDIVSITRTMSLCGDNLGVYSGEDGQNAPIMAMGALGIISVLANICPAECHQLASKILSGDIKGGVEMQIKYIELIDALFSDVNPIPVKKALNLMGYECGECRLPLTEMNDKAVVALENILKKYGLIK